LQRLDFYLPRLRMPLGIQQRLGRRASPVSRLAVPIAYGLAALLVVGGLIPPLLPLETGGDPVLYLSDRRSSPLFPLATVFLLVLGGMAVLHLSTGWRQGTGRSHRRLYLSLYGAVALTFLAGVYLTSGVWLRLAVPSVPADLALGLAVVIVGYQVAKFNASVEGYHLRRDLLYAALAIASLTIAYVIFAQVLHAIGHAYSSLTLVLIVVIAVSSLMLYDGLRAALDRLFYRQRFRQLRANLRALAREAGTGQTLAERLDAILTSLCGTLGTGQACIALRMDTGYACEASVGARPLGERFPAEDVSTVEIVELPRPGSAAFGSMALLAPVFSGEEQIGALVMGPKAGGREFSEEDLILLDDVTEQLAIVIETSERQEEQGAAIGALVEDFRTRERDLQRQMQELLAERHETRSVMEGVDEQAFTAMVEDGLRRLPDYSYLGEQPLAQLHLVELRAASGAEGYRTHIDRGKALSGVLIDAIEKLRPEGRMPGRHAVPGREWHQYVALYDAYVLGENNREIMSRLYISEGTFNRTRRRAVRGVSKALREMEREAQRGSGR
jgi:hypothetical protein